MFRSFNWTALPLIAAALAWSPAATATAAEVRDRAGMFSAEAVRKADAELDRIERQTGVPIHIETIDAISDLAADASDAAKHEAVNELALKHAREIREGGLFLLISKRDKVFSRLQVSDRFAPLFPERDRVKVRDAMVSSFKKADMDGGLLAAAAAIDDVLPDQRVAAHPQPRRGLAPNAPGRLDVDRRPPPAPAQFGLGSLLTIALGILGVLFVIRLFSGAFGGGQAGYPKGMPGAPGMGGGPGYGPGYGGGYGRGGGFFSSLLGGIGGAMAGNWIYDQFTGRHSGGYHTDATNYTPTPGQDDFGSDPTSGGDTWSGNDAGGGDWGGGDWGGGGGDWGGGGDDGGSW